MTEPEELFIVYELWHIDEARARGARGTAIVCLDFLVERELTKERIPYISLRDIVDSETETEEWWLLAQKVAREWYHLPAMKFFEHGGIRIGEVVEPIMMAEYLTRLFYYARIYIALKKKYPDAQLHIPAVVMEELPTDDCLVHLERLAVADAARMAGFKVTILGKSITRQKRPPAKILWKLLLVRAYNLIMSFVPHRKLKIYASEYWSHIGPIIEQMDDAELVLMGSGELKKIPWRQLFAHRIRIRHPSDAIRDTERNNATRTSERFVKQWETAKKEVAGYLNSLRRELDWGPVLEACEYLIKYAPRVITDINAVYRIMKEEKPNIVLQLASVGARQDYFFIMARIAAQLKIPSLELQHAGAYIDPRVVFSHLETDYLATYGADTNAWHERIGHARSRLIPVGSPRFDRHFMGRTGASEKGKQLLQQLGLDANRPVLLVAVPYLAPNLSHLDSYQLAEFFMTIRAGQNSVPGMQTLFKCRNYKYVDETREYLKELFSVDYAIAGSEDVFALLCASDAVVCGNSTVIYETMLAKKPLLLCPWKSFDTYHAQVYEPATPIARTTTEAIDVLTHIFTDSTYRDELLARQEHFLEKYSFDGKSSERMGAFIRRISRKQHGTASN